MTCKHMNFISSCRVDRITGNGDAHLPEDQREVKQFLAEFTIHCTECGVMFAFDWREVADPDVVPLLVTSHRPYTTFTRDTLCAPIIPQDGLAETYTAAHYPGANAQRPN